MALQRLIAIAFRWFPILVLGLILPGAATYRFTSAQPQVYQVSSTLLPGQLRLAGNPDFNTVALSRLVSLATNYAYAAKTRDLLTAVEGRLGLTDSIEDLTKRVDAVVDQSTAVLTITARADTAQAAADLANAVAHEIEDESTAVENDPSLLATLQTVRDRILESQTEYERLLKLPPPRSVQDTLDIQNALTLVNELTDVYATLSTSLHRTPPGLVVVYEADPQLAQMIAPRTLYYTLLAAVAGLLIAGAIVSVLEYRDDTVRSPEDIQEIADVPTLGTIAGTRRRRRGTFPKPATLLDPASSVADAYRTLRANIEFASVDSPIRTILLTSSLPGEGTTVTAANLAVAFAQAGRRVLLVDANTRKPRVNLIFGLPNERGLTALLEGGGVSLEEVAQSAEQPNLRIVTTGPVPSNPSALLGAERIRSLLDRLRAGAELVILDAPSLQAGADAAILSSFVDGTILVVAAGRSHRRAIRAGLESLATAHATVIGTVFRVPRPRSVPVLQRQLDGVA